MTLPPPPRPVTSRALVGITLFFGIAALLMWADGHGDSAAVVWVVIAAGAIARRIFVVRRRAELRQAHEHHRQEQLRIATLRSMDIAPYHAMGAREFERAIGFLCERDGCRDVKVVGGAGDFGADVLATVPDGRRIVIQCKRYGPTTKVGSQDMQRFGGTCWSMHGAQIAAVVTTSVFTRPADKYAVQHGIGCFDADALAGWVSRTGPAPWM